MGDPLQRSTPLVRWRGALLKLDSLRPSGGCEDRALGIFPELPRGAEAAIAATGGAALAAAGWARRRGVRLAIALHGATTHEVREALKIWGASFEPMASREAALRRARELPGTLLPPLDGPEAGEEFARTLGAELLAGLAAPPAVLVAPAGAAGALVGSLRALRSRWPRMRAVALVASDVELPDLPRSADLAGVVLATVSPADAARARAELARTSGVLASHASAAAAMAAGDGGVALVTSAGEREFSLEQVA